MILCVASACKWRTYPIKHQAWHRPLCVNNKAITALERVQASFVEAPYVAIVTLPTL